MLLEKCPGFGASGNTEVQNQLVVGVLEILTDTDESRSAAKKNLKGQALELFRQTLSRWNNAEFGMQ
uniref:Uncharacterized protein n=1 Tax=Candidatus Kentrum sp. TC TaxID=2126339 RepID=A0A451A867_9GAMM|nr:MAG: hypothetical protein BECKTC1821E_GA0114239_10715 [Candidatus Kentron sp. TC]VFK49579.1 MAG: hypothetical protein BECKTC1821D_GA0114238_108116 [Candidatus Kentron sp. TC]VFK62214.1 MAG: hypothetical protein BECKTC1821F_GA0114240_10719 [Candidatus Kentron sp. TC]